ncbi:MULTISPECIES: family 16 glycosylhydrolase [unclassified Sphingobacterium]|uniref:family 16 glycosylhydrolase n=1 Tax=unclassified Sphingobacterium TaxID=2609468 RepID=UPI0025F56450|nr:MULTISPECIES: family 16 glycosylhydrolase [unclassified Sphingobacterium]
MMTAGRLLTFLLLNLLFLPIGWGQQGKPVKTTITKVGHGFTIMRNGRPYFIKGAGGTSNMEQLKAYGGNSIRTWSPYQADEILNKAQQLGLTVTLGLDVKTERHGFDYNDPVAVAKQKEYLRTVILKYKDHPALLAWGIGNELNLHYSNPKVWDAVNGIAKMIHELDPNHLVTTMLAGVNQKEIDYIKTKCPALDLIAVQVYGGLASVPEQLRKTGWNKPYIVTEWGPTGHWEGLQTPWGASIEETSHEKAAVYKSRYEASIGQDKNCLGSYVFLWGQKQERTPTWYGLFTEAGEENEVVDVMHYLWSGKWPDNRAPQLDSFLLDNRQAKDFIYLESGKTYPMEVFVQDPDGDKLRICWELLHESTDLKEGGDREERPQALDGFIKNSTDDKGTLTAPSKEGAYRLFVYASDGNNNVATANIPFYVRSTLNKTSGRAYHFSPVPVWSDEFNYSGLPDKSKWSYDIGSLYDGWGNNELQYYMEASRSNSLVQDGVLKITAKKENKGGKSYTSARLTSKNKGDFTYGRFEARAKLPLGRGSWPAIWMLPTDRKYGDWPNSGEIDILEHVGYDQDIVHISTHTKSYNHGINTQKTSKKKVSGISYEFHTYRIDWTPSYIKGFVDEWEIFNVENENKGFNEWPFDQKFHWLINLAVGGNWGGKEGVDDTIFPATFEIDYVRVYDLLK